MGIVHSFLKIAVGLLDEIILAHAIRTRSENPYASAKDALVLYAQNAQPMLVNAAWLTLITWALSIVVFFVMLAPAAFVVWIIPGTWSAGTFVFAILFAWAAKVALIEPFAIACMLQAFIKITDGQVPKPDWIAKLDNVSKKFGKLTEKAKSWVWDGPVSAPATKPAAPPQAEP